MAPKITALMAENAIKDGAEVKDKRGIARPEPKVTPIPAPVAQNDGSEQRIAALEATIAQQRVVAQKQSEDFLAALKELSEFTPLRFKVHRNMDRSAPDYLLMEYFDLIPVKFTRKLDS